MWLTLLAMRNGIAILMASLAVVLLGATSLARMPIALFPNINYPSIRIGTVYKGANVQDVERTVTYPIEKAVSTVTNVRHVESRSRQGFSAVDVTFNWGADLDAGLTKAVQRVRQLMNALQAGVQPPSSSSSTSPTSPCASSRSPGAGSTRSSSATWPPTRWSPSSSAFPAWPRPTWTAAGSARSPST